MDKPCRNVDSTDDTDCYEVDGRDISVQSKRDVGIMLEVIVTYTNKCVRVFACNYIPCCMRLYTVCACNCIAPTRGTEVSTPSASFPPS